MVDPDLMRRAYWGQALNEVEWNAQMKAEAVAFVRKDPAGFARRLIERVVTIFSLRTLIRPVLWIRGIPLLSFGPVLILSLIGFAMMIHCRRWKELSFFLPFLAGGLGPGVVMMGIARHRMPFDWIFILLAALCLSRPFCRREEDLLREEDGKKIGRLVMLGLLVILIGAAVILTNPHSPPHTLVVFEKNDDAPSFAELLAQVHAADGELDEFVGQSVSLNGRLTTPMPRSDGSVSYYFVSDDDSGAADLTIQGSSLSEGTRIIGTGRVTGLSRAATLQIELIQPN